MRRRFYVFERTINTRRRSRAGRYGPWIALAGFLMVILLTVLTQAGVLPETTNFWVVAVLMIVGGYFMTWESHDY